MAQGLVVRAFLFRSTESTTGRKCHEIGIKTVLYELKKNSGEYCY